MTTPTIDNGFIDLVDWCDETYLQLNVGKTKEIITDYRRNQRENSEIEIKEETVVMVRWSVEQDRTQAAESV